MEQILNYQKKPKKRKSLSFNITKPLKAKLEQTEKEILEKFNGLPENYHIIENASQLGQIARLISSKKAFAFDVETSGLDPWRDEIYCKSIWVDGKGYLINFKHEKLPIIDKQAVINTLGEYYSDNKIKRIGFNCLAGSTKFLTKEYGIITLQEVAGELLHVLDHTGTWKKTKVESFGFQKTKEIKFSYRRNHIETVRATKDHRWLRTNGPTIPTYKLRKRRGNGGSLGRDRLPISYAPKIVIDNEEYKKGVIHGIVYSDGTAVKARPGNYIIRLCGYKAGLLPYFSQFSHSYPPSSGGDPHVYITKSKWFDKTHIDLKSIPVNYTDSYLIGFFRGVLSTDGCIDSHSQIHISSVNKEYLEWFSKVMPTVGYSFYNIVDMGIKESSFGVCNGYMLFVDQQSVCQEDVFLDSHKNNFRSFKEDYKFIESVPNSERIEEVFCVQVEGTESFTLSCGLVTGNCKFDNHFIEEQLKTPCGYAYFDSYAASWLLDENIPSAHRRLKPLSEMWLHEETLGTYTEAFGNLAWILIPPKLASYYAIKDAELHYKLAKHCEVELKKYPKIHKLFHNVEMPILNAFFEFERDGFDVATEFLDELDNRLQTQINDLVKKMNDILTEQGVELPSNWLSKDDLAELFYNKLKLTKTKETAGGKASVDKWACEKIQHEHPIVPLYLEFANLEKQSGTFISSIKENMIDGRLHTSFKVTGTDTGRCSSGDPFNLQNVPIKASRGGEVRQAFKAADGYYLVSKDFSGQELRLQAALSGDTALRKSALSGTYYSEAAVLAYGGRVEDYPKHGPGSEKRDKGKATVLLVGYGGRGAKVASTLGVPKEFGDKFVQDYKRKYFIYTAWEDKLKELAKKQGYTEYFTGRRRRFDFSKCVDENGNPSTVKIWALERNVVNSNIQGPASEQLKRAFLLCYRHFNKMNYKSKVLFPIHDELLFKIHKDEFWQTTILQEIDFIMKNCCPEIPIEFEVSTECYLSGWGLVAHEKELEEEYRKWYTEKLDKEFLLV